MLATDPDKGPYSRFNARRATPAQVATGFVPPDEYWELASSTDPQLLIGPRGIGKTTLLKMLMTEALEVWDHEQAPRAHREVRFTGAFVAADKMWAGQLDQLEIEIPAEHRSRFGVAAFSYMALGALARAGLARIGKSGDEREHDRVELSVAQQEELAAMVADSWHAPASIATMSGLEDQMGINLAALGTLMQHVATPGLTPTEIKTAVQDPLLEIDFFTAASLFIDLFNKAVGQRDHPWVILIDEFEFLPDGSQRQLGGAFQGRNPRLSFKMSIAPYTGRRSFAGTPLNDWLPVHLSRPRREQADHFSDALIQRQIADRARTFGDRSEASPTPQAIFREGGFEAREEDSYAPGSENDKDAAALAAIDTDFKRWFEEKIGAGGMRGPDTPGYNELRKAMPLIRLRLAYLREGGGPGSPHRIPELYAGIHNIRAMGEGNPRWLKALTHALLERWEGGQKIVPRDQQARAIQSTAEELYNTLKAVPIEHRVSDTDSVQTPAPGPGDDRISPFQLITRLGIFLREQTHGEAFRTNQPGAFKIDVEDPWVQDVVHSLVFLGALVYEDAEGSDPDAEAVRLAHMWAPIFRLLPRKGRERSLRVALERSAPALKRRHSASGQVPFPEGGG